MTAVTSVCVFKKLIKIVEFLCSHFNIEDRRKKATFSAYYALSFQKRQKHNWNTQKKFVQCMEKVLWLIKTCQKQSFMLEISCWDAPQSGRPVEVNSYQIKTLIVNSQHYNAWEIADSKYPNQVPKIICTSLVVFMTLMFGFHICQVKKTFLTISACYSLLKRNKNVLF